MSSPYWIGGTGSQSWTNTANWSTGAVPVTGDSVFILQGNSDIQTNLAQSSVSLASLTIAGSFSGTIGSSTGAPLQIGCTGTVLINTQSSNIGLDVGSTTPQVVVAATGLAAGNTFGSESFRLRGGGSGVNLYVAGSSSVGVATDTSGITATLTSWNIAAGTLNLSSGVTWTNGYQSGGVVTVNSGGTLIEQSGTTPSLITGGSSQITTLSITGRAVINNRPPSGTDAYATLSIGHSATADHSQDPRPLTVTNAINMAIGSRLIAFDPTQIQTAGSTPLQIKTQQCGIGDVSIQVGAPVLATVTGY
jgi:hypothetical protein